MTTEPSQANQQINAVIPQRNSLAKTRNLLLPKLMFGEIRLSDAEKLVVSALCKVRLHPIAIAPIAERSITERGVI